MVDSAAFVSTIRSVVGDAPHIGLHVPEITAIDHQTVDDCLTSTFVSSVGPFVTRSKKRSPSTPARGMPLRCRTARSRLQVALVLAGVERDDEVIVPALVVHRDGERRLACRRAPPFRRQR